MIARWRDVKLESLREGLKRDLRASRRGANLKPLTKEQRDETLSIVDLKNREIIERYEATVRALETQLDEQRKEQSP